MVDVIPLCVDTCLLAYVIAMWYMLNHIWFEVDITSYFLVVDVKTTEADVIVCYISLLLADVIANTFVVDVKTT